MSGEPPLRRPVLRLRDKPQEAAVSIARQDGIVDAAQLMNGRREITVRHKGEDYRLRITSKDRLILTK